MNLALKAQKTSLQNQKTSSQRKAQVTKGQLTKAEEEIKEPEIQYPKILNSSQREAYKWGLSGKSFCLLGKPGTGKTTTTVEIVKAIAKNSPELFLNHKFLAPGIPAFLICSFTNRAVNNIKFSLPLSLQGNALTNHKALEYSMKKEKYVDKKGEIKTRIEFYPKRNSDNPLTGVKCFILEESTLTDLKLFSELEEALPKDCVKIFLGDLNQLPPVFGQSILAEKLASGTPFVELTKVYRQKGGSPILDIVLACINGKAYSGELLKKLFHKDTPNGKVSLNLLKKKISPEAAEQIYLHNWLPKILKNGEYVPGRDVFLLPFNKALGTIEANKVINQYYSQKAGNPVYEVIAGWAPYYFAKGDFVLHENKECWIQDISPNPAYSGMAPKNEPSIHLGRYGENLNPEKSEKNKKDLFSAIPLNEENLTEEAKNSASHIITLYCPDDDREFTISSRGDISSLIGAHALTVHKSQGSEWEKVFCFFHESHANMLYRELVTTAFSRAKRELHVFAPKDLFKTYTSKKVRLPGNSMSEKVFNLKLKKENQQ